MTCTLPFIPTLNLLLKRKPSYEDTAALRGFGRGVGAFVVYPDHAYFLTGTPPRLKIVPTSVVVR
jgi:hypothetical protein